MRQLIVCLILIAFPVAVFGAGNSAYQPRQFLGGRFGRIGVPQCPTGSCPTGGCPSWMTCPPGGSCPNWGGGVAPPFVPGGGVDLGDVRPSLPPEGTPVTNASTSARPQVVKIQSTYNNESALGTGTIVKVANGKAAILSCAHILKGDYAPSVILTDGRRVPATILAVDALYDVSVLSIDAAPGLQTVSIAKDPPKPNVPAILIGYASGMNYQEARTKTNGYHGNWIVIEGPTANGTSGGPILTDAGIVGVIAEVISDNRSKVTRGANCQWIREWIKQQGAKCDWILGEGTTPPPPPPTESKPRPKAPPIEITVPPSTPQQPCPPNCAGGTSCVCPPGCVCPVKGDCDEVRKEVAELKGSLTALIGRIDKIAAQPGPQGPQGPAGKDAVVDYDRLAAEVAKRLPPMTFQMIGEDGKVKQSFKAGLGETVPFQLVPVTRAQ